MTYRQPRPAPHTGLQTDTPVSDFHHSKYCEFSSDYKFGKTHRIFATTNNCVVFPHYILTPIEGAKQNNFECVIVTSTGHIHILLGPSYTFFTFQIAYDMDADQTARIRRLVCAFVVRN